MGGLIDEADNDLLAETIVSSEPQYTGDFLTMDLVKVLLPDGKPATRDIIRHPGAVAIIALDGEGRILLVHQYRTALERVTVEVPAGKLEAGEDPVEAVRRELKEETGYIAGEVRYLVPIAVAVGYSDEIIHMCMATDLVPSEASPDEDEYVAADWVELQTLVDSVLDGRIEDSKTVIAALVCDALSRRIDS
ncbi:MAG: NUDIX hydrolase [Coriobacteriaceae bacterium]|nr:NUDIX hydrolase [Coriobacteriaceae bacterium]